MKIVIAPDKFKGTLTAPEAAAAIAEGARHAACESGFRDLIITEKPMADGGEGSLAILTGSDGAYRKVNSFDALMRPLVSEYGILPGGSGTAVVEAASTIGLYRIAKRERDPLRATSFGLGAVLREAIADGCAEIVVAIGGTATSDCGAGMLAALGCRFYDGSGNTVEYPAGGDLGNIYRIDTSGLYDIAGKCRFRVMADVDNPLLGERGAAAVFSTQKGADAVTAAKLEAGAARFSSIASQTTGRNHTALPGSGAAGGIGWALKTFCEAEFIPGAPFIAEHTGTAKEIKDASLVVTGEGRFDMQSLHGKAAGHIAELAQRSGIPVIVLCGMRGGDLPDSVIAAKGISGVYALTDCMPREAAFSRPAAGLRRLSHDIFRYLLRR